MPSLQQASRIWHMARSIPPGQMLRRLALKARFAANPYAPERSKVSARLLGHLPPPVFARRDTLRRADTRGFWLRLAWGERFVPEPVPWIRPLAGGGPEQAKAEINNLHFMEFLEGADDAAFVRLVQDWIAHNPRRAKGAGRYAWRPYNLSLRTVIWLQEIARRRPALPMAFVEEAAHSLDHQFDYLANHLETDLRGNHLIKNVKALLWGSTCFTGASAERWRVLSTHHLRRELDEQILPDGCHYERSPAYHCQVLADLIECWSVIEAPDLKAKLGDVVRRMLPPLDLLSHPDGLVAPLNDGGLRMAYPPPAIADAWARLTGETVDVPTGPFALEDAGYYGLAAADARLMVDCGPLGPPYLAGHGHGDLLAVEWSLAGRRVLVDQGTLQYVGGPGRARTRATAGHNTVTLDDKNQSDFYGAFRVGRRARPMPRRFSPTKNGFVFEGTHDGYARLEGAPYHVRCVEAGSSGLHIQDTIEGGTGQQAVARFLLHPDCAIERTNERRLTLCTGALTLTIEADAAITVEPTAWYPDLYVEQATVRLVIPFIGRLRTHFAV